MIHIDSIADFVSLHECLSLSSVELFNVALNSSSLLAFADGRCSLTCVLDTGSSLFTSVVSFVLVDERWCCSSVSICEQITLRPWVFDFEVHKHIL